MPVKWLAYLPENKSKNKTMSGKKGMKWRRKMPDAFKVNIREGQIIQRLERYILDGVDMPAAAVTAALGLLKKKMPDLAATTLSGDAGNPITLAVKEIRQTIVRSDAKPMPELGDARLIELTPDSTKP